MPLEVRFLLSIHSWSGPGLDRLFRVSHQLGTLPFCAALVLSAAAWCLTRGERRLALLWILAGLATEATQEGLKRVVARPRPALWPYLIPHSGYSFPSGHALASAAFFPLIAWTWSRARPREKAPAWTIAVALLLFVGFGRLYLGVHWPSDVLAGWALGVAEVSLVIRLARPPQAAYDTKKHLQPTDR
jgi:membrane-associated phospholipid phosphatase